MGRRKPRPLQDSSPDSNERALHRRDDNSESEPDTYTDLGTDPDIDIDTEKEACSDDESEGERLRRRIDYHKGQGRAKSRRSGWSSSLVAREVQIWKESVSPTLNTHSLD
jgi:hypothetical protein